MKRFFEDFLEKAVRAFIGKIIREGSIEIELANGHKFTAGDGTGKRLGLRFNDSAAILWFMADPELCFGELFMDSRIDLTSGTMLDVLMLAARNLARADSSRWVHLLQFARWALRRLRSRNDKRRARRNVAHHYDLHAGLYTLFLDSDLQYSCAYFEHDEASLEEAQLAKKRHIAAKLLLAPGHRVLDIGCGWGGLAIYLARFCGASLTGLTLSKEQLAIAESRAA